MSDTKLALDKIKVTKATGPARIPPWALKECSHLLAAPVTAIFNSSLREGVLPKTMEDGNYYSCVKETSLSYY